MRAGCIQRWQPEKAEAKKMNGFAHVLKMLPVFLILSAFSTLGTTGVCIAISESEAELRIEEAETAVSLAYVAVLEAEKSGADISGLLMNLTYGGNFLAEAQMCYRNKDFGGAVYHADLSVQTVVDLEEEAEQLKASAIAENKKRRVLTVTTSGVAVVVIVLGSAVGWLLLKQFYFKKVLEMKPEEVER